MDPAVTNYMAGTITTTVGAERVGEAAVTNRRGRRRTFTLGAAFVSILMLTGILSSCETSDAERLEVISMINASRVENGVPPLTENLELNLKADAWAATLRDRCEISHSRLADGAPRNWQKLGENVGRGGTISQVHVAYLNSPGHRKNILDPSFNQVGAGAVWGDCNGYRTVFTVQVFMRG